MRYDDLTKFLIINSDLGSKFICRFQCSLYTLFVPHTIENDTFELKWYLRDINLHEVTNNGELR